MNIYRVRHFFWIIFSGMILLIISCDNDSVSEDQAKYFLKYYAMGIADNTGTTVIKTSDGYAILCNFENVSGQDILVIFTDRFGRRKTSEPIQIGTDLNDHGYGMISFNGGYLICGTSYDATHKMGYLVNITSDGTILWEQNYSYYQELEFRDAYEAQDGNLIMTGYFMDDQRDEDVFIFKTTAMGDSIWIRQWSWTGNDIGESIIEYDDLYHVLITSTDIINTRESQIRVLSTTVDGRGGTYLKFPDEHFNLSGTDLTFNQAGQIFILANDQDPGSRVSSIFLAELELRDTPGGKLMYTVKSASISDLESLHAASFTPVGTDRLAIGGWQSQQNDDDILFMLVDTDFQEVKPRRTYGSSSYQASQHIISIGDDGFALTGSVDLGGGRTTMLLKIDPDGELK